MRKPFSILSLESSCLFLRVCPSFRGGDKGTKKITWQSLCARRKQMNGGFVVLHEHHWVWPKHSILTEKMHSSFCRETYSLPSTLRTCIAHYPTSKWESHQSLGKLKFGIRFLPNFGKLPTFWSVGRLSQFQHVTFSSLDRFAQSTHTCNRNRNLRRYISKVDMVSNYNLLVFFVVRSLRLPEFHDLNEEELHFGWQTIAKLS